MPSSSFSSPNPEPKKPQFPWLWIFFLMIIAAIVIVYAPSTPSDIGNLDLLIIKASKLFSVSL